MIIKQGYNGKETIVRISAQENGSIELWIEQAGITEGKNETLSYLSLDELHKLYLEVKQAGRDLFD